MPETSTTTSATISFTVIITIRFLFLLLILSFAPGMAPPMVVSAEASIVPKTNTAISSGGGGSNTFAAANGGDITTTSNTKSTASAITTSSAITTATSSSGVSAATAMAEKAAAAAAFPDENHRRTYIAQLIVHIRNALRKLGVDVDDDEGDYDASDDIKDDNDESSTTSSSPTSSSSVLHRIESMAILIHESMSISSRNYHSVQHALDVAQGMDDNEPLNDPIAILAALFHDCVYYHVDGGLSELQLKKLKGAVACNQDEDDEGHTHKHCSHGTHNQHTRRNNKPPIYQAHTTTPCNQDRLLCMVEYIFGYGKCQSLTHATGLNEFLSAMIAVRELEPLLTRKQLAQIACCIEMTIPFRPTTTIVRRQDGGSSSGEETVTTTTPTDRLYANMVKANEEFDLGMTDDELVESVQRACVLANSDVANFGTTDVLWFLDNTWSLLPESNEALRRQYLYTVQQFQFAVYKMYGFFSFLQPDVIFPSFRGIPTLEQIETKCLNAKRNLQVGRRYVGAKLLSISVLSAIAELTGGDAPISLFMGDLPSRHGNNNNNDDDGESSSSPPARTTLEAQLGLPLAELLDRKDSDEKSTNEDHDDEDEAFDADVYSLLAHGRRSETDFDIRQSPLAAYLYGSLGNAGMDRLLQDTSAVWPMTEAAAWKLLAQIPLDTVLTPIAENMCKIALSRCDAIRKVLLQLKQQQQEQESGSDKKQQASCDDDDNAKED